MSSKGRHSVSAITAAWCSMICADLQVEIDGLGAALDQVGIGKCDCFKTSLFSTRLSSSDRRRNG